MGYMLHRVEGIGSPFLVVHEQSVLIPKSGVNRVDNQVRKLVFILEGECRHRLSGAAGRGSEVQLGAGDILVIPHALPHEYVSVLPNRPSRIHAVRLAFQPGAVPPLPPGEAPPAEPDAEGDLAAFTRQHLGELAHLPGGQDAPVRELLSQLRQEAQGRLPGFRHRVRALCISLTTLAARQIASRGAAGGVRSNDQRSHHVTLAKDFLLRHLDQPLHLEDVAAHLHLSEEYVARLFKQSTGQTVFGYVRQMRLEQAKTLLSGSDLNISEIAQRTAFGSVAAFSRCFKSCLGVSPTEYRGRLQREIG